MKLTLAIARQVYDTRIKPRLEILYNGCHTIPLKGSPFGYKSVHVRKIQSYPFRVHVVVFVVFHRELLENEIVRHECDNAYCCNPEHLLAGTHADNIHDMDTRNRRVVWHPTGTSNPAAKLTPEQVKEIRNTTGVMQKDLAIQFGVSKSLIGAIKNNEVWQNI